MGGRKLLRGAAVALALALAAAGCSGGGESPTSPVTESTTTAPPTLAPTTPATVEPTTETTGPPPLTWEPEPTKPAELSEWNEVGAEAFALYAVEVINYAQKFNKPDALRAISDPECAFCNSMMSAFDSLSDADERRVGGESTFKVETVSYQPASGLFFLDGHFSLTDLVDYSADGLPIFEEEGGSWPGTFVVGLEEGEWLVFQAGGPVDE